MAFTMIISTYLMLAQVINLLLNLKIWILSLFGIGINVLQYGFPEPFPVFNITLIIIPIIMFLIIFGFIVIIIFKTIFASHSVIEPITETAGNIISAAMSGAAPTGTKNAVVLDSIPDVCPNCGAHLGINEVKWTGPLTAECPYCGYKFKVKVR